LGSAVPRHRRGGGVEEVLCDRGAGVGLIGGLVEVRQDIDAEVRVGAGEALTCAAVSCAT